MGSGDGNTIYCYKGFCPSNFESSDAFVLNVNRELAKDGLVWVGDAEGPSNLPNHIDPNELKILDTETLLNESNSDWAKITLQVNRAFDNYFKSYEDYLKKINERVIIVDNFAPINFEEFDPKERELYKVVVDRFLTNVNPIASELFMLQTNPKLVPAFNRTMAAFSGDPTWEVGIRYLQHNVIGTCPYSVNSDEFMASCSLFPVPPNSPTINGMLPWDITESELTYLTEACKRNGEAGVEALRPDTIIEWATVKPTELLASLAKNNEALVKSPDGSKEQENLLVERGELLDRLFKEIKVTQQPKHPVFQERCKKMAQELRALADLEVNGVSLRNANPELATLFESTAIYLEKGDLASATAAMNANIRIKDGLYITIFWTETYDVGFKHQWRTALGMTATGTQQWLGGHLKYMVTPRECRNGTDKCSPLNQDKTYLKAINVVAFTGALIPPEGSAAGWNDPNYEFPGLDEMDSLLVQNVLEKYASARARYKTKLLGKFDDVATPLGSYGYITAHEMGHTLLKGDDIEITTGPHRGESAKALFGESWVWYKETHADLHVETTILNMLQDENIDFNSPEGLAIIEDARQMFFSHVFYTIAACPPSNSLTITTEAHQVSSLIRNGWWIKHGLYRIEGEGENAEIVFNFSDPKNISREELIYWASLTENMATASKGFMEAGDVVGYRKFLDDCAAAVPKEFRDFTIGEKKLIDRNKLRE